MSDLRLDSVSKQYAGQYAVKSVSLQIQNGESVVLLGPSGCGKTTALRMVAGFVQPTGGRIFLDDIDITNVAPRNRNMGMVFQNYALFPNMTVAENIAFGLKQRKESASKVKERVGRLIDLIKLNSRADSYPSELSGGQQQRVALARALAIEPRILLMDEPLSALDLKLREEMQLELRRLQQELNITMVFVTHDQHEAMALADRIAVMSEGALQQLGTPTELYHKPTNDFIANFIGKNNLLSGEVINREGDEYRIRIFPGCVISACSPSLVAEGSIVSVALRPERIAMNADPRQFHDTALRGTVSMKQFLGNIMHYSVSLSNGGTVLVESLGGTEDISIGTPVELSFKYQDARVLNSSIPQNGGKGRPAATEAEPRDRYEREALSRPASALA